MLKVWWEIFPTFNVAKSKATWPQFHNILLITISYTVITKGSTNYESLCSYVIDSRNHGWSYL